MTTALKTLEVYYYNKQRFEICRNAAGRYILYVVEDGRKKKLAEGKNPPLLEKKAEAYADGKSGDKNKM